MSAWTQLVEPGPALFILVLVLTPQVGYAAPLDTSEQSTEIEYYPVADATGCYYNFEHYDEGDRIITNEPCLNCTCHNRMLMCYLRVCPFTKAIGQNCKVEKKADQCCPVITCPEVPVQLVPHATTPSTQVGHPNEYGCSIDNLFYADGAKVPSNPDNPCEVCYCIRNKTACIIQECTLTGEVVEGCRPVYIDGVCCPVRYDCEHPQLETTPRPLLTTTTTTLPPTSSPSDCIYNNEVYSDGALVKKDVPCEQCYCMRGDIVCAVQECGPTPLDKVNCTALPPKEGQCCPDTYECENISEEDLTTLSYYDVPTTQPTIVSSEEGTTPSEEEEVSTPQATPRNETEGQISDSTTSIEDHTKSEESPVTESATSEPFTSRITEAVEAVTSKVTEIVEAITSTIAGSGQEVTTAQPESFTKEVMQELETPEISTEKAEQGFEAPETSSEGVELEPEASAAPEQSTVTETEHISQTTTGDQQPVNISETEEHPEQEVTITEGYVQETKIPEFDDQKHLVTSYETKPPVTTESLTKVTEVQTETPESVTDHIDQIIHDDHETEDEEHENENELVEGSGQPPSKQEPTETVAPEADTEEEHIKPIDHTEVAKQPDATEQPSIVTTTLLIDEQSPETEPTEGSGITDEKTATTAAPEMETEADNLPATTQQPISITYVSSSTEPEGEETSQPEKPISEEPTATESSDVEQTETETPILPEVETTISEQEQPHADVTRQPEEATTEAEVISSKEEEEEKIPEPQKEIVPTVPPVESQTGEESAVSITDATSVTETQKEGEAEQKPEINILKEEEGKITTERQEEELEFVTEISTKETEKPQSMDHVSETISPAVPSKPELEIPSESVTTEKIEIVTELSKESEAGVTIQPEEKPTQPSESEEKGATLLSEVTETPVDCQSDGSCASGQEETQVVEECTKENCAPSGAIPQAEDSTETIIVQEGPIGCTSEHDCVLNVDQESVTEVPLEECDPKHGCGSVVSDGDKEPEKPLCDPVTGCVPEKEGEVTQSCINELECIPSIPEKEGEISREPALELCQPGTDCSIEPMTVTESDELQRPTSITEKIDAETTVSVAHEIGQTEEESSGQQPTTFTPQSEEIDHTEGSGQDISEEHTESGEEFVEGTKAPKFEEKPEQETEQSIIPEKSTEKLPSSSEEQEQITTVEPEQPDLENELEPEGTSAPEYDKTDSSEKSKETESSSLPDIKQESEEVTDQTPEGPSVTEEIAHKVPEVEGEIENEITPQVSTAPEEGLPESTQAPEGTRVPEINVSDSTISPEQSETSVPENTSSDITQLPDIGGETEVTHIPEIIASGETEAPDVTQLPKEIATATESLVVTQVTEESTSEGVQPTDKHVVHESTLSPDTIPVTTVPEGTEKVIGEGTEAPEQLAPESTQSPEVEGTETLYASSEATLSPEEESYGITTWYPEVPEKLTPEGTQIPEQVTLKEGQTVEITEEPKKVTESSQPSEESAETEAPVHGTVETVQSSESTESPEGTPEQFATENTVPERTHTTEQSESPETTPEAVPDHSQTFTAEPGEPSRTQLPEEDITPEQNLPETTSTPEIIVHQGTQIPEIISDSSEKVAVEETQEPQYVTTETPGTTQSIEGITEMVTEAVSSESEEEHGIPGEGSCLVDGQTYKNNSNVPPINQCQTSCKCISSILQCESVSCTPPPSNLQDCMPIFHSPDSCCPTYSCSVPGATSMESDSHVVETTTSVQVEEKPVTIGIQLIPSEQTTIVSETPTEIPSKEEITSKPDVEPFVTIKAETVPDVLQEHITEIPISKDTEAPEEESTEKIVTLQEHITELPTSEGSKTPEEVSTDKTVTDISQEHITELSSSRETDTPEEESTSKTISGINLGHTTELPTSEGPETLEEESTGKTESEISSEPVTEIPASKITETPQEISTQKVPAPEAEITTQTSITEVAKEEEASESQSTVHSESATVTPTEIKENVTTEGVAPSEEQHPEFDETENEVQEEHIVPEHCDENGCRPEIPAASQVTEHPVPDTITEVKAEDEGAITEQPVKEGKVPVSEETEVTEEPVTEEDITSSQNVPDEGSSEGPSPESPFPSASELPERDEVVTTAATVEMEKSPESITESIVEEKTEQAPKREEEISTEQVSEGTSESVTESIKETSKTPEEIAAIPEIEEVATLPSILPESITEAVIPETEETPSSKGESSISTTEPQITGTEQTSTQDEGEVEIPVEPESVEPSKPETEAETEITKTESYPITEHTEQQPEALYPDKVTTSIPPVEITETQQILETTSPALIHITESEESITGKPESAAHVTEAAESVKSSESTPISELMPESTTQQVVEDQTESPIVPQEESKPEGETIVEPIEVPAVEHETTQQTVELGTGEHAPTEIPSLPSEKEKLTESSIVESTEKQTEKVEVPSITEASIVPEKEEEATTKPSFTETEEKQTEELETVSSITEAPVASETEKGIAVTEKEQIPEVEVTGAEQFPTPAPTDKEAVTEYTSLVTKPEIKEGSTAAPGQPESSSGLPATTSTAEVSKPSEIDQMYDIITTQAPSNETEPYTSGPYEEPSTKKYVEGELSTSVPLSPISTVESSTSAPTYAPPPVLGHDIPGEQVPELPDYHSSTDDYEYEEQGPVGPGTCRYGGKVYVSAQQIPRDDPCDFCFCFRSDIICLQQSCPPPIPRCHEEPIRGFCCPRYECPVGMATAVNITTSTTSTTTTLPPHFLSHAYKGRVKRTGCQIKGKAYRVGEEIKAASGPCLHCTCGGDGEMKCDPKVCSPEPMLRQMIAAAVSRRRR